jgi:hypothetical protein
VGAQGKSRIVRLILGVTTAAIMLATAMVPIVSPGSAAKGNARHGHALHQTTQGGQATGNHHPQVEGASNKRGTKKKNKGSHRSGQPTSPFNPPSPTAPTRHDYTETRTFTADCIAYPEPTGDICSVDLVEFIHSTPLQIEAIPTLPCGRATVSATGWITGRGDTQVLARQDIPSGVSTGVIDLGTVKSFSVGMRMTNFEGCGPIFPFPRTGWQHTMSVTYSYTSPTYLPVLTP